MLLISERVPHRASQMKTILVPAGGGDTDQVVFETAMAAARPLAAHLEFLHIHVGVAEAARHTPHIEFASGAALRNALNDLAQRSEGRAVTASDNVREFCARWNVEMIEKPCVSQVVTARWRLEEGDALERLVFHARHNDLVVMGRPTKSDGLPQDRLESLLMACGRPLLIASSSAPKSLLSTVMVCWKEAPDAARAVSAAMPLLTKAERVVLVSVRESADPTAEAVAEIVRQLEWHGINADARVLSLDGRSTAELLAATARECGASLSIMGGYGHRRARELLFGGCTQAVLEFG